MSYAERNTSCPLCHREIRKRKPLLLYDHPVCKKCYYGFANRRQAAFVVDWVGFQILSFGFVAAVAVLVILAGGMEETVDRITTLLGWAIIPVFFCKDSFGGCSPGKALCGVRVIEAVSGEPIGLTGSIRRNLPLIVPFMPLIIAVTMGKGSRVGDGWAGTKVVWSKYANLPVFSVDSPVADPVDLPATLANPIPDDDNPYRSPLT